MTKLKREIPCLKCGKVMTEREEVAMTAAGYGLCTVCADLIQLEVVAEKILDSPVVQREITRQILTRLGV